MPLLHRFAAVSACAFLLSAPAVPQQTQAPARATGQDVPDAGGEQDIPQFTSTSTEVIVPVTVTDDRGKFVTDLQAKDFRILDEGKPQHIEFFSHAERQPIVVGFLLDLSNSQQDPLEAIPGSGQGAGLESAARRQALLGLPDHVCERSRGGGQHHVGRREDHSRKIDKLKPGGGAALYDAIYKACTTRNLVKGEPYEPRRIIIVIGDGHDSASSKTLERGDRAGAAQPGDDLRHEHDGVRLRQRGQGHAGAAGERDRRPRRVPAEHDSYKDTSGYLSNPSGRRQLRADGRHRRVRRPKSAKGIIEAVAGVSGEITTQYVLRYMPDVDPEAKTKAFRRIKVDIPGLPNVKLHHRPGYWPNGVPGAVACKRGSKSADKLRAELV